MTSRRRNVWSFISYLGRAQPPPSFRGVSGHRGESRSARGPSSSCLGLLSSSISAHVLFSLLQRVSTGCSLSCARSPPFSFQGPLGCVGVSLCGLPEFGTPAASQALEPRMAQLSGVSWSAVLQRVGRWSQKDPSAFASSAGVSPGKKGPGTLTSPLGFLRSGAARLRMPPGHVRLLL